MMMMKIRRIRLPDIFSQMIITHLSSDDRKKARQGALSVKVTSRTTLKRRVWEWVWATDKVLGTMLRMNQVVLMLWRKTKDNPSTHLSLAKRKSQMISLWTKSLSNMSF